MNPLQRLVRLLGGFKRQISLILLFAAIGGIVELSVPLGIQAVINLIMGGQVSSSWVVLIVLIVVGVLVSGYLNIVQLMVGENLQQSLFAKVAYEFTYRLPRIRTNAAKREWLPELVNRFFDTITLQKGIFKLLYDTSKATMQIVLGFLLLVLYNPIFAIYSGIILAVLMTGIRLTVKRGLETGLTESKYKYKLVHWLEEVARTADTFKLSGISSLPLMKTDYQLSYYLKARKNHFKILMTQYGLLILLKALASGSLLFAGGLLVMQGNLTLGQFVAAEIVIILLISSLEKVILSFETIFDVLISVEKLGAVTDFPLENADENQIEKWKVSKPFEIELKDVSLDFEDGKSSFLQEINLHIKPGEKVALVGFSGCGRTTLLKTLAGFYKLGSGNLLINGMPIPEKDLANYRLHVGDGIETIDIFEGNIRENISLGRPDITEDEIDEMILKTGIRDYLVRNNMSFDLKIYPTGKGLASGLQYRIILARTFCGNPGLVVLEDPVVPIPLNDRQQLLDLVFDDNKPLTLVASTNRKDFVKKCDKVVWLRNGRIVEVSTPDKILPKLPDGVLF